MSSNRLDIGCKINDNGWIDFQGSSQWIKPTLDFNDGQTTFETSELKDLLKEFIDVDKTYFFQGIKINPEVDKVLRQYKLFKDKITRFGKHDDSDYRLYADDNLVESYFSILKQKLSEDGIPHISYDLATEDSESYVPGILAWPKIFIITKEEHQNLVNKVNSMNTFDGFDEKDSPRHSPLYAIVRNANINPLILDKDTSLEVKGDLVQKMSNLLLTYSAKHKSRSNNDDD